MLTISNDPTDQAAARKASSLSGKRGLPIRPMGIWGMFIALLIMLALKHHYSTASADQLNWILAPTATLLAWFTTAHPVYESGVGYVDFTQGIIVAPACAGINFMIMAFGLTVLCGLARVRRQTSLFIWLAVSMCTAFIYTLLVNTIRIHLSMALYNADIYTDWITPERVHRMAGIGLYLGALWFLYIGIKFVVRHSGRAAGQKSWRLPSWLPAVWYLAGAAGVPVVNMMVREQSPSFWEHVVTVVLATICLCCVPVVLKKLALGVFPSDSRKKNVTFLRVNPSRPAALRKLEISHMPAHSRLAGRAP